MRARTPLPFQPSLFDERTVAFDPQFRGVERIALDDRSWVDHQPGFVSGADLLFDQVLSTRKWGQRKRWMYDKEVLEPRLTAPWNARSGAPLDPPILKDILRALTERYQKPFDSIGFNLYRDGHDSVAWHTDHISKDIEDPVICLLSVGEPRKFLMRPKGGGKSLAFHLGRGDLLVTGGRTNRDWDHSVPKVAQAGPRISLAFRYGMDPRAYAHKKMVEPTPSTGQNY